jgi:hypothetical protein
MGTKMTAWITGSWPEHLSRNHAQNKRDKTIAGNGPRLPGLRYRPTLIGVSESEKREWVAIDSLDPQEAVNDEEHFNLAAWALGEG